MPVAIKYYILLLKRKDNMCPALDSSTTLNFRHLSWLLSFNWQAEEEYKKSICL